MQKVETEYHFITSSENEPPIYICKGACKKAYWKNDFRGLLPLETPKCQSCDGAIVSIRKDQYKILEHKITPQKTNKMTIGYLSQVKPEFIEFAKTHWAT